ncbi:MAG TPA: flagellar basal body P-ring formation protein FlgA [Candidatus Hydrogenedentes bacterium]|nr:flagellar basal body P-ring formation protein FlgA [Candidatus Hydrogenedentota bacterium]
MDKTTAKSLQAVAVVAAAVFALTAAAETDTVTLQEEVYIKGPRVILGEVAEIEGENAESLAAVEIGPAATPGNCARLSAALVISRLKSAGYEPSEFEVEGSRAVRATTLHLEVTPDYIAEHLRGFIRDSMPWEPSNAVIDVDTPAQKVTVSDGHVDIVWRANPQYRYLGPGSFRGDICVDGEVQKTLSCRASVEAYQDVVAALKDIPRGKPMALSDMELATHAVSSLPGGGVFYAKEDLMGYVAQTTIFEGQVITNRKVAPKRIIKRNQIVTVEARVGALVVRDRAKAMQHGCAGDVVTCLNPLSKEEFQGVVREDGVVILE